MKRSKSSKQWMNEHVHDPYVQRAQKEGYRTRAAYKLLEMDDRDRILKPGMVVVDLGAAPGGWSQVAASRVGKGGSVIAVDILPLCIIDNVEFIQGDFCDTAVVARIEGKLGGRQIGLVISDMAPNISGISMTDQARAMNLAELALEFAVRNLQSGGTFLVKVFQGIGYEEFVKLMRCHFSRVVTRKPDSSRDRSKELYLLGTLKF